MYMKTYTIFISLCFTLLANIVFADDPFVTSPSICYCGQGEVLIYITGTNGSWIESNQGYVASLSNLGDLVGTCCVEVSAASTSDAEMSSSCYLTVPVGRTASIYYISSISGYGCSAYFRIDSTYYQATYGASNSGNLTLQPGTYYLETYTHANGTGGTSQSSIDVGFGE
jgi:hypothetical protein